jgi:alpha-tubulin suppressor-like RCC1 family protein
MTPPATTALATFAFVLALVPSNLHAQTGAAAATTPGTATAAVAFGTRHAVALRTNGEVLTWGENVSCQLGRAGGNASRTPALVMRNAIGVAAASDHTLVLTASGKVYGWGQNAEGPLGLGNTYDQCEGPAPVESLASVTVTQIATGYGFSVAVTKDGDLYCSGDNSMGQCPVGRAGRVEVFTRVPTPELAGTVVEVRAGLFHTLIKTRDGKLHALGRGRDGQLGNGRTTNGFATIPELTDVVSFAAGTWHSVAARADGSVWAWGHNAKSQLCDGGTANVSVPTKVALPAGTAIAQVAAGGHGTLLRTADGGLLACGDNQFGPLGIGAASAPTATPIPTARTSAILGLGGANGAVTSDGCDVRLVGDNDYGIVSTAASGTVRTYFQRPNLSLCAPRAATDAGDVVNPAPKGGVSGCWTTRVQEDGAAGARFAGLRAAMLAGEELLKKNAAFLAAPQPVRFRTSMSAGPLDDAGARMHIKAIPERKTDGTRLWAAGCEVIPQVDRIGGAIAQISIFFNQDARASFIGAAGKAPSRTGTVGGYPEYDGWVIVTRDGRLPWIPQTLADRLDEEGEKRQRTLADVKRRTAGVPGADAAANLEWLEKQVRDYQQYRASFSAEQLRSPAVWGDPSGAGRTRQEAEAAALRELSPDDQRRFDALGLESRTLERQAQVETRNKNADEAARLRERSRALAIEAREIRQAHMTRAAPRIMDSLAAYDLTNIQPGTADQAIKVKRDPSFPDMSTPNRVQAIAVMFSFGPKPTGAQLEWQTKVKESFDFAALAAMLR